MNYVLIFAFGESLGDVLLVKKARPDFMKGKWNGLGGRLLETETAREALDREFREESGLPLLELVGEPVHFHTFGWLKETNLPLAWSVDCFAVKMRGDLRAFKFRGQLDEPVEVFSTDKLPENLYSDCGELIRMAKEALCPKS